VSFPSEDCLIGCIDAAYAAARGAAPWSLLLQHLIEAFPGTKVAIASEQPRAHRNMGVIWKGYEDKLVEDYVAHYARINPWTPYVQRRPTMTPIVSDKEYPSALFENSDFYQGFIKAAGDAESSAGIKLFQGIDSFAVLSLHYGKRVADSYNENVPRFLGLLAPHLKNAVEISAAMHASARPGPVLTELVQQFSSAAFLLDRIGVVREANDSGRKLLDEGLVASFARSGQLWIAERAAHQQLSDILATPYAAGSSSVHGAWRFLVFQSAAIDPRLAWLPDGETWIVALFEPRHRSAAVPERALRYGLTRQEIRVAMLLADGLRVSAIADALDISTATVRQHLKSMFAKTHTHAQGELIATLAPSNGTPA